MKGGPAMGGSAWAAAGVALLWLVFGLLTVRALFT